jgi:hypothetical protein
LSLEEQEIKHNRIWNPEFEFHDNEINNTISSYLKETNLHDNDPDENLKEIELPISSQENKDISLSNIGILLLIILFMVFETMLTLNSATHSKPKLE